MSLNVSALATWTDELSSGLVREILLKATTINGNIVSKMYGVKGETVQLNTVATTINGSNSLCGWVNTGTTTMGMVDVTLCPIKFQDGICLDTLEKYYYSWFMEKKYNTESLGSFEEEFFKNKTEYIAQVLDRVIWVGTNSATPYKTGLTGNDLLCSGFLQTASNVSASTVNMVLTAFTVANAVAAVDTIAASIAANIPQIVDNDGLRLYIRPADFQNYLTGLRNLNLFNYNTQPAGFTELVHPGTSKLKVTAVNGMSTADTGRFICTVKDNIWLLISDESDLSFKTWYSLDNDELRMSAKIKIGTGFRFPALVIRVN